MRSSEEDLPSEYLRSALRDLGQLPSLFAEVAPERFVGWPTQKLLQTKSLVPYSKGIFGLPAYCLVPDKENHYHWRQNSGQATKVNFSGFLESKGLPNRIVLFCPTSSSYQETLLIVNEKGGLQIACLLESHDKSQRSREVSSAEMGKLLKKYWSLPTKGFLQPERAILGVYELNFRLTDYFFQAGFFLNISLGDLTQKVKGLVTPPFSAGFSLS